MKKEYIKPEIVVEEILLEGMLLSMSMPEGDGPSDEFDANKRQDRRGTWGNLWSEE